MFRLDSLLHIPRHQRRATLLFVLCIGVVLLYVAGVIFAPNSNEEPPDLAPFKAEIKAFEKSLQPISKENKDSTQQPKKRVKQPKEETPPPPLELDMTPI